MFFLQVTFHISLPGMCVNGDRLLPDLLEAHAVTDPHKFLRFMKKSEISRKAPYSEHSLVGFFPFSHDRSHLSACSACIWFSITV